MVVNPKFVACGTVWSCFLCQTLHLLVTGPERAALFRMIGATGVECRNVSSQGVLGRGWFAWIFIVAVESAEPVCRRVGTGLPAAWSASVRAPRRSSKLHMLPNAQTDTQTEDFCQFNSRSLEMKELDGELCLGTQLRHHPSDSVARLPASASSCSSTHPNGMKAFTTDRTNYEGLTERTCRE